MARRLVNLAAASPRVTTVIDPTSSTPVTSKQRQAQATARVTTADVQNPTTLARLVQDAQRNAQVATQAARTSPLSAPCIVRNVAASLTALIVVRHTLGRKYTSVFVCNYVGGQPNFSIILPGNASYPAGVDQSQAVVLVSGCQGTYDFAIGAD